MTNAKIAYSKKFERLIGHNPSIIRKFLRTYKEGALGGNFDGFSFEPIRVCGHFLKNAWHVKVGTRDFFMKESRIDPSSIEAKQDGYAQFLLLCKIASKITGMFPHIEVVEPHLGFTNDETSFLVMAHYKWPRFIDAMYEPKYGISDSKRKELKTELEAAGDFLKKEFNVVDLGVDHAFYGKKGDRLALFDPYYETRKS